LPFVVHYIHPSYVVNLAAMGREDSDLST